MKTTVKKNKRLDVSLMTCVWDIKNIFSKGGHN